MKNHLVGIVIVLVLFAGPAWPETLNPVEQRELLLTRAEAGTLEKDQLEEGLQDSSGLVRRTAMHLVEADPDQYGALIQDGLHHEDPDLRILAIQAASPEWIDVSLLTGFLTDPNPFVRQAGVVWSKRLDLSEDENVKLLSNALRSALQHDSEPVRARALEQALEWESPPGDLHSVIHGAVARREGREAEELAQRLAWPFQRDGARNLEERLERSELLSLPLEGWRFQLDSEAIGHEEGWYEKGAAHEDWKSIEIGKPWQEEGHDYIGVAWYQAEVEAPELAEDTWIGLQFDGVDESAWVWINGEYVGEHDIGPGGWNVPFLLDATDLVRPGETNQLTVRVRNTGGLGGIYQPVHWRLFPAE